MIGRRDVAADGLGPYREIVPECVRVSACGPLALQVVARGFGREVSYELASVLCGLAPSGAAKLGRIAGALETLGLGTELDLVPRDLALETLPAIVTTGSTRPHAEVAWFGRGELVQVIDPRAGGVRWWRRAAYAETLLEIDDRMRAQDWRPSALRMAPVWVRVGRRHGIAAGVLERAVADASGAPSARELASVDGALREVRARQHDGALARGEATRAFAQALERLAQPDASLEFCSAWPAYTTATGDEVLLVCGAPTLRVSA